MKSNLFTLLCLAVVVPSVTACTFIEREIGQDFLSDAVALLSETSHPHVDDVLSSLGPPQAMSALPGGYIFLYQYFDIEERQLGISSEEAFFRWFKLALADAEADVDSLVLKFGRDNRLVASGLVSTREELGDAGSILFTLSFQPLVDTAELDADLWGADRWGMSLLQSPKVTLNLDNSLDSGKDGLELRGSPTKVGQRTMEYR